MRLLLGIVTVTAIARVTVAEPAVAIEPKPRPPVEPQPEPGEPPAVPATGERPLTAADVRGAPVPGDEHGRLDPLDPGDSVGRRLGRGLLWIPRLPIEAIAQPMRGFLYSQDHYRVVQNVGSQFQTSDRSIAIYPTALFETGFGFNVGARARFADVFGLGERISARVGLGGEYLRIAALGIGAGKDRVSAGIDARYAVTQSNFYGYGNGDETEVQPATLIDPVTDDTAIATEHVTRVAAAYPYVTLRLPHAVTVNATAGVARKRFETGEIADEERRINEAYNIAETPGFMTGTTHLYTELELGYDTRRRGHDFDAPGMRSAGGRAIAFVGRQHELGDDSLVFYRTGIELQRYIRLGIGPRRLELRAYGEYVTAPRDQVAFSELPRLGGATLLRGYATDRFRDRLAVVTQASYTWAISRWLAPSVFVDAGRVYSGFDALTLDDPRVGYGIALEAYGKRDIFARFEIASSIDGGLQLWLSLAPTTDTRGRGGRY